MQWRRNLNVETLDDQITTTLPPCLENLVNDIKSLQNGKFGKIIAKFAGNNPTPINYNWHLSAGNLSPSNAETGGSVVNNTVTTTLDSNYINIATDLSIARTLIHEAFHAYLVSVFRFRDIDMSYVNLVNTYFPQFNNNLDDTHHHIFATTNIVDYIAVALMEYGNSKGYNLTQQFCNDMAWAGMHGTNTYAELPPSQRARIESTLLAEATNSNNNLLNINPKGTTICP